MDSDQHLKTHMETVVEEMEKSPELRDRRRRHLVRLLYQRLLAGPGLSIVFHIVLLFLILKMATGVSTTHEVSVPVTVIEPKQSTVDDSKVDEVLKQIEQNPPEMMETDIRDVGPSLSDQPIIADTFADVSSGGGGEEMDTGIGSGSGAEQGFEISAVRSPIVIKGLYANRTAGGRKTALTRFGGAVGDATENAVLRSLRWLKKVQEKDGSWQLSSGGSPEAGAAPAMTGFALLAFLAHGETPSSEEFGETVEAAIKWLVKNQKPDGRFNGSDGHEYSLPIASYALCEAYSLTHIPMVKEAARKSTDVLIKGQTAKGLLWDYNCKGSSERDDLSYAGWCMQAIKAAKMAGLDNPGLDRCMKKAVEGLKMNYRPSGERGGGFSYTTGGGPGNLTGVGVLCMQLLGASNDRITAAGLKYLEPMSCEWSKPFAPGALYYWYYGTQAKFQAGESVFKAWNRQFASQYVKNQTVIPKAIKDSKGELVDVGYWINPSKEDFCKSWVYSTVLCTLTLEVYYRYLPTYLPAEDTAKKAAAKEENVVEIDIL